MLALAGLTFTYTSCTDYSEDINANTERIDDLSGRLATAEGQIKKLEETDGKLQTAIDAANTSIKALQSNAEALEGELAALKTKHSEDITALQTKYDAELAALKASLKDEGEKLEKAISDLTKKHNDELKSLEDAYKAADKLLNQAIEQNASDIKALQADVKKINDETIPAVKNQIAELEKKSATKQALADSTVKVVSLVNTKVGEINGRIKVIKTSLDSLTKAHNTLASSFEETKKAHDASIKALEDKVVEIEKTHTADVTELKGLVKTAQDAADKAQKTADDAIAAAKTAQDAADKAQKAADDAMTAAKAAQATASEALGKVDELVANLGIYAKKGELAGAIQGLIDADLALAKADSTLDEKVDSIDAAIAAQIVDLVKADKKMAENIDSLFARKFDKSAFAGEFKKAYEARFENDFTGKFTTAINAAIAEDGVVYDAIKDQVSAAYDELKGFIDGVESKVDAAIVSINSMKLVINDLANRIQSIVFVPEYDDLNATLHYYYIKSASDKILPFSDTKTVDATFEVYPAKLAGTIKKEDVSVVAVNVATRAAAAVAGEIVDFKNDAKTGRLTVTVKFGKEVSYDPANKKSFAISMRVQDNAKQTVDEKEYETGNYVESSFVGVSLCEESDLTGKFVVYNGKGELASGVTLGTEKQWSAAPAAWDPFEGYDFYVKIGTKPEYLTLAEAAAKFNLDVKDITPVLKNTPSFSPAASSKYFDHKGKDKAVVLGDLTTAMIKDKVIKADGTVEAAAVGSVCKDVVKATVKGVEIFNATTSYKIGRRKVTMTIDPYTIDWTYGTAVKLSSAKTAAGAYKNAINAATLEDELLKELKVSVEGDVEGLDIKKAVDGVTPVANHKLNGKAIIPDASLIPSLKVDPLAIINAHLATIEIAGGTYEFGKAGVANVYSLCNTYANDPTFTDVDVKMTLTLGSRPNPVKVELPEQEIAYEPDVVLHKLTEAATIDAAFNQEGVTGFKNLKEFKDDFLAGTETVVKSQRVNVKPVVNCSGYTYFSVTNRTLSDVPFIRLSQADLTSYDDKFAFETKVDTWYGVSYGFATTASLLKPAYSLIYHEDLVDMTKDIPTVTIAGTKATGIYEINTDDLSKYFGVEKCNAAVANFLKIKYEYVTPLATSEWEAKGYENRPYLAGTAYESTIDGAAGEIKADGSIKENPVVWGDFTARDMVVRATLFCNGVEVNALDLKLTIEDPIKEVSIKDIAVKRDPYADVTVNLWQTTTVKSILSDDNQVNQAATTKAGMWKWNADAAYGLDLTYDTKYTVFVNGKDVTAQFPASKFVFDAAAGTILYKKDAAHQVNDVKIEVTAHLAHKFNYNNKNTEEVHKDTYTFYVVISE